MGSNKTHIDEQQFWDKTRKIRVPTAAELEEIINKFDFTNVDHVIIGTGTNDTDSRKAEDIFPDLLKGAKKLQDEYGMNVYVSQVPPRKNTRKMW